jgi:hypothetical protein
MADLFETGDVPDSPEHWDALARRIATQAARQPQPGGITWLAESRAAWLAASVLIAVALGLLWTSSPGSARATEAMWQRALAPSDDVGRTIASPSQPPAIGSLLFPAPGA